MPGSLASHYAVRSASAVRPGHVLFYIMAFSVGGLSMMWVLGWRFGGQ